MRNFTLCFFVFALISFSSSAQNVNIPDPKLMEALLEHGVDTNGDLFISFEEAEAVDSLSLFNKIADMTGIEAFTSLRYLDLCNHSMETPLNLITFLDVTANTSLEYLDCSYNQLDTLIVGTQDNLLGLNCFANPLLTHLDLTGCPNLQQLWCGGNPLEELDISACRKLEELFLDEIFDPFNIYVWTLPFPPDGVTVYGLEAEVAYYDVGPPEVTLLDDHVYLPGSMGFSSDETGVAYLLNSDTLDALDEIRTYCLDSLHVFAEEAGDFDLSGIDATMLWIRARDLSQNISGAAGFSLYGVGIRNAQEIALQIYPNPAGELITVRSDLNQLYTLEIADINGRIIFSTSSSDNSLDIDLSDFRKGIYLLRISDSRNAVMRKFIKL